MVPGLAALALCYWCHWPGDTGGLLLLAYSLLVKTLPSSTGPAAVAYPASSTFLKVSSKCLCIWGRLGLKVLSQCFFQRCWCLSMSISFLKASLEHLCNPSHTSLAKVVPSSCACVCASNSSSHWSVQPSWCCYCCLFIRSRYFAVVALLWRMLCRRRCLADTLPPTSPQDPRSCSCCWVCDGMPSWRYFVALSPDALPPCWP